MKHDLVELVVHLLCDWVVMCSDLAKNKTKLLFCQIFFWHGYERVRNPSSQERQLKGTAKGAVK